MKQFLSLAILLLFSLPLFADINTMNYQAVINNAEGKPVADSPVGFKFEILLNNASLFEETTTVTSNNQGLVEWLIGSSSENGLSGIDWAAGNLVLRVSVDINGGQNYSSIYESAIQSVPTAMYAAKSGDSEGIYNAISSLDAKTADIIYDVDNNRAFIEENRAIIEESRQRIYETESKTFDIEVMLKDTIGKMYDMQAEIENRYMMMSDIINELQSRITNLEEIITALETRIYILENN